MKIVISIGGSLLYPEDFDFDYAKKFTEFIIEIGKNNKILLVTGGGKLARNFIEVARKKNENEFLCDLHGIEATRMNAQQLAKIINGSGKKTNEKIPENCKEAMDEFKKRNITIMGGTSPGHSTDAVAALMAEYINADLFINATNVSGVYNKNPKENKDAKLYEKLSSEALIRLLSENSSKAGKYELMDFVAAQIIHRSKIRTIFLNGKDLKNFRNAIEGKKFVGTEIN